MKGLRCVLALLMMCAVSVFAEDKPGESKPRVFITDSQSWEMVGGAAGGWNNNGGGFAASTRGGARPQTAEIIKTFGERCPQVTVNNILTKVDYVVVLDHEGGKGFLRHRNKVAVFSKQSGDAIVSKSTLSLGGSVQDACGAIQKHWAENGARDAGGRVPRVSSTSEARASVGIRGNVENRISQVVSSFDAGER